MRIGLTACLVLILAACAVGPNYHRPAAPTESDWLDPDALRSSTFESEWWYSLGDSVLADLVRVALDRNLDLRAAAAELREARANRDAAFGARLPQINATGSVTRNDVSANGEIPIERIPDFNRRFSLFDAGFDASWEIDFWGRNARAVEAADARVEAELEALRNVRVQTIAEVARNYIDMRSAQSRLASAAADTDARSRTAQLVQQRFVAGEASRFDAVRAAAQTLSTRGELPHLDAAAHAAAYSLALLTGRAPEALLSLAVERGELPATPPAVGIGLRSELLRRRPDVRKAERELAAATADIGVATADLFPRVTLIASVGQQSERTANFLAAASQRYQFGPSLSWPIFAAGRIRAQVRAAGARADAAAARYEKAVLTALSDSETAVNRYRAAGAARRDLDAARSQSADARQLAEERYRAGEDDLLALLDSESEYRQAERAAFTADADELTALVALYKSLGGGWENASPVASTAGQP